MLKEEKGARSVISNSDHQPSSSAVVTTPGNPFAPVTPITFHKIIEDSQTPYQRSKGAVKRKVAHALNLTTSPYKAELQNAKKQKVVDENTKRQKQTKRQLELRPNGGENINKKQNVSSRKLKKNEAKTMTTANNRRQQKKTDQSVQMKQNRNKSSKMIDKPGRPKSSRPKALSKQIAGENTPKSVYKPADNSNVPCFYCFETVDEGWIQCPQCQKWAHIACAGVDDDEKYFLCEQCNDL